MDRVRKKCLLYTDTESAESERRACCIHAYKGQKKNAHCVFMDRKKCLLYTHMNRKSEASTNCTHTLEQ